MHVTLLPNLAYPWRVISSRGGIAFEVLLQNKEETLGLVGTVREGQVWWGEPGEMRGRRGKDDRG